MGNVGLQYIAGYRKSVNLSIEFSLPLFDKRRVMILIVGFS